MASWVMGVESVCYFVSPGRTRMNKFRASLTLSGLLLLPVAALAQPGAAAAQQAPGVTVTKTAISPAVLARQMRRSNRRILGRCRAALPALPGGTKHPRFVGEKTALARAPVYLRPSGNHVALDVSFGVRRTWRVGEQVTAFQEALAGTTRRASRQNGIHQVGMIGVGPPVAGAPSLVSVSVKPHS